MRIFDAHFHIIDFKYPVVENNGYLPPEFTVENYLDQTKEFQIQGGAIVSGSFQAFDQTYLIDALKNLGSNFFGVANIPHNVTKKELDLLRDSNIVAIRFNLKRGGSATIEHLVPLSNQLFDDYGWHTELYVDSKDLAILKPKLQQLQKFSIDHLGLTDAGVNELLYWVERGVKVKATGFGRINFSPIPIMKKINQINPNALMFGTDLPSTRAKTPFSMKDIELVRDNFCEDDLDRIFYQNAKDWYS